MASREAEELAKARETIAELEATLEQLANEPLNHGVVLQTHEDGLTIAYNGQMVDVKAPTKPVLKAGDALLVFGNGAVKERAKFPLALGPRVRVNRMIGSTQAEVQANGAALIVLKGQIAKLEEGDEVLLDSSGKIILKKLPAEKPAFQPEVIAKVHWDDIGGQEDAKREMREAIEMPHLHPEIFKFYGKRQTKGVLLYGPPGCGKTMVGKAVANALSKDGPAGFIYVKGPEVLDPFVGVAEATVRSLFDRARAHKAKTGNPAVIFIDEADAILGARGTRHAFMEKTIVPTFLAEMDGVEESGAVVILATNRSDTLDPAVVRDGRIDRKVRVGRPTQEDSQKIFGLYLKKVPLAKGEVLEKLCADAAKELFCTKKVLYHIGAQGMDVAPFLLSHIVSGSMVEGIVDRSISRAIHRDLASSKRSGITTEDVLTVIHNTVIQNLDGNHEDAIVDFTGNREVTHLRRQEYAAA